jgi:hypothetical protein
MTGGAPALTRNEPGTDSPAEPNPRGASGDWSAEGIDGQTDADQALP